MSKKETVASALLRGIQFQEYELRSAAEAMPEDKYSYRPAEGKFKNEKTEFGPAEVRTFAEQIKHVACSNFGFAAELDGQKPPDGCDKVAQTRRARRRNCSSICAILSRRFASRSAQSPHKICMNRSKDLTLARTPA